MKAVQHCRLTTSLWASQLSASQSLVRLLPLIGLSFILTGCTGDLGLRLLPFQIQFQPNQMGFLSQSLSSSAENCQAYAHDAEALPSHIKFASMSPGVDDADSHLPSWVQRINEVVLQDFLWMTNESFFSLSVRWAHESAAH